MGVNLQATSAHKSNISLANLNALSSATDSLECPTLYDIPNSELKHIYGPMMVTATEEKTLYVFGVKIPGHFDVGKEYPVFVNVLTCGDSEYRMCCKPTDQMATAELL